MSLGNHYTRGGQLAMHRLRMFFQIFRTTLLVGFLITGPITLIQFVKQTNSYELYLYKEYLISDLKLGVGFLKKTDMVQEIEQSDGKVYSIKTADFVRNKTILNNKRKIEHVLKASLKQGGWILIAVMFCTSLFFTFGGRKQFSKKLDRGAELISSHELASLLNKNKLDSDLVLDHLPLLKNKETSHMLITGTTGAGKSNCLVTILPQIRKRPNKAIIVDLTGDFISKFYQDGDILLNPFDQRSQAWSLWKECQTQSQFDAFAEAMIPQKRNSGDSFWEDASRTILVTALQKFAQNKNSSIQDLYELLVKSDLRTYHRFFEGTEAASFTDKAGERTTVSIRSTLASQINCLKHLQDDEGSHFSIREWVATEGETNWLFLTARPDMRKTLKPLMTAWMDIAINALMTLPPNPERRIWFLVKKVF